MPVVNRGSVASKVSRWHQVARHLFISWTRHVVIRLVIDVAVGSIPEKRITYHVGSTALCHCGIVTVKAQERQ